MLTLLNDYRHTASSLLLGASKSTRPNLNRHFQDSFVEGAKLGQQGRRCQELQINIPWVISLRAVSEEVNFHQHTYF